MRQEIVQLIDDIDGAEADETVKFALDGNAYEIDLRKENAAELRDALAGYVESGRRVGPALVGKITQVRSSGAHREELAKVRAWAGEYGIKVAERGRVPERVLVAYRAGDPNLAR